MVTKELVLALDIGTSSARAALFDLRGRRIPGSLTQIAYQLRTGPDGAAELDLPTILRAAQRCYASTLRRSDAPRSHVVAIASCGLWHSLLGVDARGNALTPVYTWADSRCRQDAARLRKQFSERAVHARTGCMLRTPFWPAKLAWLRRTQPALFRRVVKWMSPAECVQQKLAGQTRCSLSMASGTGLLDVRRNEWTDFFGKRRLNELSDEPLKFRGALWFPAIGDGAASNLGSDATQPGIAAINYGTSAAVRVMSRETQASFGLFCYRVDAKRSVVGGAISNAGNLRAWCLRELKFSRLSRSHSSDLRVLPFWLSERAPFWEETAGGTITGITQATTCGEIARAMTVASFERLKQIAGMLPVGPRRFVVSGGISKSREDLQLLANVLQHKLIVCSEPEASLRGAAVFALEKLGVKVPALPMRRMIRPR
jgi:gluconokinase